MVPAFAGGFLTTEPPGKLSASSLFNVSIIFLGMIDHHFTLNSQLIRVIVSTLWLLLNAA